MDMVETFADGGAPADSKPAVEVGGEASGSAVGGAAASAVPSGPQAVAGRAAPAERLENGMSTSTGNSASNVRLSASNGHKSGVTYRQYRGEEDLVHVMRLIDAELSEPYSIFTYRYFLHQWPTLCVFACNEDAIPIGTIVAKVEPHKSTGAMRGYIAMLVVEMSYRGRGIGTELVRRSIAAMVAQGAEEIVLEAETHNVGALAMYEGLGFIRDKRLERHYLSGSDAFRLKLLLPPKESPEAATQEAVDAADQQQPKAAEQLEKLQLENGA